MFEGEHTVSMDDKGRVSIPAGFREALRRLYDDERVVITRDFDGCLRAYPPKEWERDVLQKVRAQNTNDAKVRAFARYTISPATTCSPDKQGRVLVSPTLRKDAALNKQVVFAGGPNYFEIWDVDRRDTMIEKAQALLQAGGLDF
jgi:MraZ protein